MEHNKLEGIVSHEELENVGCEMAYFHFADLLIFSCPTEAYLVKRVGHKKYEIVLGYIRDNLKDPWR